MIQESNPKGKQVLGARGLANDDYIVDGWYEVFKLYFIHGVCEGRRDEHLLVDSLSMTDSNVELCSDIFWDAKAGRFRVSVLARDANNY